MEPDLQGQKGNYEGRFHNFDVILVPLQNSSEKVAWKRSFQKEFFYQDPAQLAYTSHNSVLVIACVPFQPFYIPIKNNQFVGIDLAAWKIITTHLKLKVEFLEAKNNGITINMVRTQEHNILVNNLQT